MSGSRNTPVSAGSVSTQRTILGNSQLAWAPSGALGETFSLTEGRAAETQLLVGGTLYLFGGCYLAAGQVISNISFQSATGATGPTHQWFCLVDQSLNVLAKTVDDTTTAWTGNATKTLAISGGYTPGSGIAAYLGIVCTGTTPVTLIGYTMGAAVQQRAPRAAALSTTALTDPTSLGGTAAALSSLGFLGYGWVS